MAKTTPSKEHDHLREILRNHTSTVIWRDPLQQLGAAPEELKRLDKEVDITAKAIEALLSKRELEARVDEVKGAQLIAEMAARIEGSNATVKLSTLATLTKDRINKLTDEEKNTNE
jgi:HD superfamily phosphodiesterase